MNYFDLVETEPAAHTTYSTALLFNPICAGRFRNVGKHEGVCGITFAEMANLLAKHDLPIAVKSSFVRYKNPNPIELEPGVVFLRSFVLPVGATLPKPLDIEGFYFIDENNLRHIALSGQDDRVRVSFKDNGASIPDYMQTIATHLHGALSELVNTMMEEQRKENRELSRRRNELDLCVPDDYRRPGRS